MPVELWSDTVWVFVDYNNAGVMERLPLLPGATLTATSPDGKVIEEPDNNKGVWVAGNARSAGSFSATVKLLTEVKDVGGACVYGSNYPPVGEYISATEISFTGTPMYEIVLKDNGGGTITRESGSLFSVPASYTVQSFSDKTEAPGIVKCMMPATYTLQASALDFCAGSGYIQFALSNTETERNYQLFRDNSAVGAILNGTGNAATFTGSFNEAGAYTARTIADDLYCAITMDGTRVVVENPLPAIPDVISASRQCAGMVTLSASSPGAIIEWYANAITTTPLHTGTSYTTPKIETSTTYYTQARVGDCLSARVPVLATVITDGCCTAPGSSVTFTAFNTCSNATTGDYWHLTDTRESNNIQTYKVTKMPDGHIWMVQDLKFGDKCGNKTTFSGSTYNRQGNVSSTFPQYYGDCSNIRETSTSPDRGYFYDWAAVLNKSGAYAGSTLTLGCTGTGSSANACQGICPVGWHVPTGGDDGEYRALIAALISTVTCVSPTCDWSLLNFTVGGWVTANGSLVWSQYSYLVTSSLCDTKNVGIVETWAKNSWVHRCWNDFNRASGNVLRCVRNY
jgi:uncharacterized protein (TIGR02145 family)